MHQIKSILLTFIHQVINHHISFTPEDLTINVQI